MRTIWLKRTGWVLILGLGLSGLAWFAWPAPIGVDLAAATKGAMEVTVDDEAKTRVRHIYTVSAPIGGRVLRISPPLHVGDEVTADQTIVAVMQPTAPAFLDVRSRQELEAAVASAEAAVRLAEAEVRRTEAALNFSLVELRRAEALARTQVISAKALDQAKFDVETNNAALASVKAQLEVRRSERASAAARLIDPSIATAQSSSTCCIQLRAPVTGRVLRIIQESEAAVSAGTPLIEFGDPLDLEVVADLLSTDVVQIEAGSPVRIDGWGGTTIQGRVSRIDPAGFVKVSALGIEEQRVRTTIDLVDSPEVWSRLGHDFRVIVHVTIWHSEQVLSVPVGALFRQEEDWAVFTLRDGLARTTLVKIGHRNNRTAEIVSGLTEGDQVILHPSDRIKDGVVVAQRQSQ